MNYHSIVTDKDIDKICDKIISGELIIIPSRACGKTHLQMRIIQRLLERNIKILKV